MRYNAPAMDHLGTTRKQGRTALYWRGAAPVRQPLPAVPPVKKLAPVRAAAPLLYSSNRGVQAFAKTVPGWSPRKPVTMTNYYNAGVQASYGNLREAQLELGDLFNDIIGAVVPGWDQRPEWMKKIVVKPDPAKLVTMAQKVAPNAAGDIVSAANKAGLNVFVNTPAGQVPVDPYSAQAMYSGYPMFAQAQSALGSVPSVVWIAGGVGVLALILLAKR